MERNIGGLVVKLVTGDICARRVDAIVNAANSQLWMGGGVAGAIKRQGGETIEQEAREQGPIAVGESVITGGGRLPARYVIHAAVMGPDLLTNSDSIYTATRSALDRARELELKSIAFPALGTGVGGFPLASCAHVMKKAISEHVAVGTTLDRIELVLFNEEAYQAFVRSFGEE